MHELVRRTAELAIRLLDLLVPTDRRIVLTSHPDFEDNIVALLRSGHARKHEIIVLAGDRDAARERARALGLQVLVVRRNSLAGAWAFARSSVCVSTHGLFGSRARPRGKRHLGLWHGEYIKAVGRVAGEPTHIFDRMAVSGELSRLVRSAETGLDPQRIDVIGVPRTDLMRAATPASRPIVIWAPTYRSSSVGARRRDGDAEVFHAFVRAAMDQLGPVLDRRDAELWMRLHPSSADELTIDVPRVVTADDQFLAARGLTLYGALGLSRALVTDYSSTWVDYLHLDRPVIGAAPDLAVYRADRGLLLQPYEWWFPGPLCVTLDGFVAAVDTALEGKDTHAEHRRLISSILLRPDAISPTEVVWRQVDDWLGKSPAPPAADR